MIPKIPSALRLWYTNLPSLEKGGRYQRHPSSKVSIWWRGAFSQLPSEANLQQPGLWSRPCHFQAQLDALNSPRGFETPLPPAVSSMDSKQVLQGLLLSQRGPPHRVLSPPTSSLTYIHPVLKAVPSTPPQEEKSEGLSSPSKCLLMGLIINSPFLIFSLSLFYPILYMYV